MEDSTDRTEMTMLNWNVDRVSAAETRPLESMNGFPPAQSQSVPDVGTDTTTDVRATRCPVSDGDEKPLKEVSGNQLIAIVGMGMRLPGGIRTDNNLWDFLINKKDAHGPVPSDRFHMDAFYNENRRQGTAKARHGYYLEEDLAVFDAEFFGISSTELRRLDPRQRLLLEVVWECMESSGQVNWKGSNIGCFVGAFNEDWMELSHRDTQNLGMGSVNSVADFSVPNRVSYQYDLKGPRQACPPLAG